MTQFAGFRNKAGGFSLIELMLVVGIIGILAAVAVPGYSNYVIKGNRAAAKSFVLAVSNKQEQYLLDNRSYVAVNYASSSANPALDPLGLALPPEINGLYTVSVTLAAAPLYTITATPVATSRQAGDGNLTLDSAGVKTGKW